MLVFWQFIKGTVSFIIKNWGWIASVLMLLFIFLFFNQCGSTHQAKKETAEAKIIADNNLKAVNDSTIVLKVTREQLALADKNLYKLTRELDSLKKHPKIIYIARPEYIPKEVVTSNKLVRDPKDADRYGLSFYSFDSVRTIGATSWFKAINTPEKLEITPNNTVIDNFSLNFGLVIAQYDDKKEKVTRLTIEPYFIDSVGNYIKPISKNLLDMHYRGANLLTVPYKVEPVSNPPNIPKTKYSLRTGFSLSVNFLNIGYTPFTTPTAFNWAIPSVGIGYSVVLVRNK
jgi:hypothetical protein